MSLQEKLRHLVGRANAKKVEQLTEPSGEKNVQLWDLRESEKAKERGIEPGIYLTIHPISDAESHDQMTMNSLTLSFYDRLAEAGFMKRGDTVTPVDNKASAVVDPDLLWKYSLIAYFPKLSMLLVKADHVDRDDAQKILVTALH